MTQQNLKIIPPGSPKEDIVAKVDSELRELKGTTIDVFWPPITFVTDLEYEEKIKRKFNLEKMEYQWNYENLSLSRFRPFQRYIHHGSVREVIVFENLGF